jgi:hypothetical protein
MREREKEGERERGGILRKNKDGRGLAEKKSKNLLERGARNTFLSQLFLSWPRFFLLFWGALGEEGEQGRDYPSFCHLNYARITGFHFTTANLSPSK